MALEFVINGVNVGSVDSIEAGELYILKGDNTPLFVADIIRALNEVYNAIDIDFVYNVDKGKLEDNADYPDQSPQDEFLDYCGESFDKATDLVDCVPDEELRAKLRLLNAIALPEDRELFIDETLAAWDEQHNIAKRDRLEEQFMDYYMDFLALKYQNADELDDFLGAFESEVLLQVPLDDLNEAVDKIGMHVKRERGSIVQQYAIAWRDQYSDLVVE